MTYYIDVYGCQMNVHDSEIISGILESEGFSLTEKPELADVILLVSCAVREHAETRVLGRASQLGGQWRGRESGKPLIVLCGCVAQEHGDSLLARMKDLDLVVGPDCYRDLPGLIRNSARTSAVEFREGDYTGIEPVRKEFPRAYVTIMRGCNNFCSYCIVPYVRGRERSRNSDAILSEVAALSRSGYGEITLLGQNVNSYHDGETSFSELLRKSALAAGNSWVRFVTSHPRDLDSKTVDVMASEKNICEYLHLPFQSGSDRVLSMMNRGYSVREYLDRIALLKDAMPDIVLSTDVITGFPGESEKDFQKTVDLLESVRFDNAFLFKYSERAGTAACDLENPVPEKERLARLNHLQELQRKITVEESGKLMGKTLRVLVTGPARQPAQQASRTEGNRMVILESTDFRPGSFVNVRITRADGWTHFGESVEEPVIR
ncbi:MAG: tRNA (N6-isopentenyl adenosine(37)-C2)-methylthiotransferase MiaB [Candidatus Aegiribacteria sp.]|nr:tRNA (N6-isopentenyl adenosine(37)-C2)-methylthiotransferase MiaB [Candidatus Aegiribacteria sp.]